MVFMDHVRRLCHWGPIIAFLIIKSITLVTTMCSTMVWPTSQTSGLIYISVFSLFSALTYYNFFYAITTGPGHLPLSWKPEDESTIKYLQYCKFCKGYKAPRSHHCRKCNRCIKKMDHHCPWINNCVGHENQAHFIAFLISAVCGCFLSTNALAQALYHAVKRWEYMVHGDGTEPMVHLGLYSMFACVFCLGLSIGVIIAVGALLFFQIRGVLRNQTAIEDWIVEKAKYRRMHSIDEGPFIFPYNLGKKSNILQVFSCCFGSIGDGINWPIAKDCDQYDLTREQLMQKEQKRLRARKYEIIKNYSGCWFPIWSQGFMACICFPLTDEHRIRLNIGDIVLVTRWKSHWMFGEIINRKRGLSLRGWFPSKVAVHLIDGDDDTPPIKNKKNQ